MSNEAHLAAASAALRTFERFRTVGVSHRGAWRGLHARITEVLYGLYLVSPALAYEVLTAKLYAGHRVDRHPGFVRASSADAAASVD
jgi:hypothetical protein